MELGALRHVRAGDRVRHVAAACGGEGLLPIADVLLLRRETGPPTRLGVPFRVGAGDRDRTGMASLEGWGSAIELHPRGREHPARVESLERPGR